LPDRSNHKELSSDLSREDSFYMTVFAHALAFFGARVLHPARPGFRDADLAELYDLTCEDLEQQTDLRFPDAVDALDALTALRKFDHSCPCDQHGVEKGASCAPDALAQAISFTGDKYEYVVEQLGYLTGNDLYDAYVDGRLTPNAIRKLFLTHIDEPDVARRAFADLTSKLK
jgi:hypothetical protein